MPATGCILGSRATLYTVATAGGAVQVGYGAAGIAAGVGSDGSAVPASGGDSRSNT